MKYMKLGFDLFVKKLGANLLIILQIVIAIIAVNFCIATTQSIKLELNLIKNIPNKKTICVMPTREQSMLKGENYLSFDAVKGNFSIGQAGYLFLNSKFGEGIKAHTYNTALIENIRVPLSKGSWDFKLFKENGINYYPIVINAEYKNLKYQDKFTVWYDGIEKFHVYVAGVLNKKQLYLSLSSSGNAANSEYFFKRYSESSENGPLLFFNEKLLPSDAKQQMFYRDTKFLFFDDATDNHTFSNAIKEMSTQGYTYTLDELIENSRKNYNEYMRLYWPFCIFIFIISLVGIISFAALNTLQNSRYFSILYLCGCAWEKSKYICLCYLGITAFSALLISLLIYCYESFKGAFATMDVYFTSNNVIVTVLMLVSIIVIPMIIPFSMMKKFSANEFIKKFEK